MIPLLRRYQSLYPDDSRVVVCRRGLGLLLRQLHLAEEVYEIEKGDADSYAHIAKKLSLFSFRVIFCPHQSLRSALFVQNLKAETKIGYRKWWNLIFFDQRLRYSDDLPDALRQLSLLTPLDWQCAQKLEAYSQRQHSKHLFNPGFLSKETRVPDWASMDVRGGLGLYTQKGEQLLNTNQLRPQKYIVLAPGSRWATKQWLLSGFQEIGCRAKQQGLKVVLIGTPEEKAVCETIGRDHGFANLAGHLDLLDTLLILKDAYFTVTNDSGAMHLASMAATPTVAVFGPTVLELGYRPWQNAAVVVESPYLTCRPCGKHGHQRCPLGTHACMKSITANQVWHGTYRLGLWV